MTNADDLIAARYGKRGQTSKLQRNLIIAVAASALLAFLGWAGFTSVVQASAPKSEMRGFEIVDQWHSTATIAVTSAGAGKATCAIQAQAENFEIVGYKEVVVDSVPSGALTFVVNTTALPVSVSIDRCW